MADIDRDDLIRKNLEIRDTVLQAANWQRDMIHQLITDNNSLYDKIVQAHLVLHDLLKDMDDLDKNPEDIHEHRASIRQTVASLRRCVHPKDRPEEPPGPGKRRFVACYLCRLDEACDGIRNTNQRCDRCGQPVCEVHGKMLKAITGEKLMTICLRCDDA